MKDANELTLKQRHWLFGSRQLRLDAQNRLTIIERSWTHRAETILPLDVLQPHPTYARAFALRWFLYGIFSLALTVACILLALQQQIIWLWIPGGVFLALSGFLWQRFVLNTVNLVIFRHAQTQEYMLYLWKDKPNAIRFRFFVDELDRRIQKLKQ